MGFNTVNGKGCCNVSIAVNESSKMEGGFNTVNGKGCCNTPVAPHHYELHVVSFNTVNGKGCCNLIKLKSSTTLETFQYRKR